MTTMPELSSSAYLGGMSVFLVLGSGRSSGRFDANLVFARRRTFSRPARDHSEGSIRFDLGAGGDGQIALRHKRDEAGGQRLAVGEKNLACDLVNLKLGQACQIGRNPQGPPMRPAAGQSTGARPRAVRMTLEYGVAFMREISSSFQ